MDMALASPRVLTEVPQEAVRWRSQELVRLSSDSAAAASAAKPLVMPEDNWESSAFGDQMRGCEGSALLRVGSCAMRHAQGPLRTAFSIDACPLS